MPLYEYQCPACGAQFEVLQRMGQGATDVACPSCGHADVERQLSTFAASSPGSQQVAPPGGCCRGTPT